MHASTLVRRSLTHYWRTNVAVVLGVATAVSVLAGALLVGESVRGSLADIVRQRLGNTDLVITSPLFFREQLAADLTGAAGFADRFRGAAPLIVADAVVTEQESGRRAGRVKVYGVDERFWRFHGREPVTIDTRETVLSAPLARELGARTGGAVLVRLQRPSDIPLESLHSRKDDVGRTLRLTTRSILDAASLGEFSLDAQQGEVMAAFVPLARLREELEVDDRVNTIVVARSTAGTDLVAALRAVLTGVIRTDDVGITIRAADDGRSVVVGSSAGLLNPAQAEVLSSRIPAGMGSGVFTYLANSMQVGDRQTPYSLVTSIEASVPDGTGAGTDGRTPGIVLNEWAARDLGARPGDTLSMAYYVWEEPGTLATRDADFIVAAIEPIAANARDLAPSYPGISNTSSLSDWDPPFPLDLRKVRPVDEDYWDRYRTTPKARVSLAVAQRLWGSRYGSLTSVRITPAAGEAVPAAIERIETMVEAGIDPSAFGVVIRDARTEGLTASQGATNFGEYFVYFSFFLVVSALVLVVLFFKLGIEQRVREVGLLAAVGLSPRAIRRLFTAEGLLLAIAGSLLGVAGAVGYAALLIRLLTTRWVSAVGTTALTLHVSASALALGAGGGVLAAAGCIWWTLRGLERISSRSLLAGEVSAPSIDRKPSRYAPAAAAGLAVLGITLALLAAGGLIEPAAGFFGAGASLLVAALTFAAVLLRRPARGRIGAGWWPIVQLAARNASHRPGRTVLSMTVIASATFILVTVDAFRRDAGIGTDDRSNGTGGYELMVRTLLPMVNDPNSAPGREAMNLAALDNATVIEPFRVRPGDDASCLNLYQPTNPRIVAPRDAFIAENRFTFQASAAATEAEQANPWLLLNRDQPDGAIPVIADANSMTYVLHRGVGDDLTLPGSGTPVTLRFVAALRDSIFQSELLMSERNFRRLFPEQAGFQLLLVDTTASADEVGREIEQGLSDAGADSIRTGDYLASFHQVENTYLSTFQTLGGLGLLLGTVGLATVLLRNVLERRRELALLAAVGYRRSHFLLMAAIETVVIVVGGLAIGAAAAALAIAPAVMERGARLPLSSGALLLLFSVFIVAMLSSLAAMVAATRTPLLEALRSE
jgi:ABC-type lipoprotein release transport system permease subunit